MLKKIIGRLSKTTEEIAEVVDLKIEEDLFIFNELQNEFNNQYLPISPVIIFMRYFSLTIKVGDKIFYKKLSSDEIKSIRFFYYYPFSFKNKFNVSRARKKVCNIKVTKILFLKFISL